MKRFAGILAILAAIGVAIYFGLGVLYWVTMLLFDRWPSQEAMVQSGYPMIPEAKQIDDLFGPAWHETANYKEPDIVEWQTILLFGGRYEMTMLVHVEVDRRSGKVRKVLDEPRFILQEISRVDSEPGGRIGVSYGESHEFGVADWQKVVAAKGDFSVIGIHLKRGGPIANFDKYLAYPKAGIQMAR